MSEPEIYWEGLSGRRYGYWIHKIGTTFKEAPGNYLYAREVRLGYWKPVYIGQTSSLSDRLDNHEKEGCAIRNGATHIHAHTSASSEDTRISEEVDLIKRWSPVCNEVYA